jgi:hypothetical protein
VDNTDRGGELGQKDLQTEEIFDGRYAVDIYKLRSIKASPRAIVEYGIDRKKYLQIGVSMGMRAARSMRAVLRGVLPARRTPLPSPQFSRIDYRSSKPPQTPS